MQRITDLSAAFPHDAPDICGWPVLDPQGVSLGRVQAAFLDEGSQRKVRFLEVERDGHLHLIPVDAIVDIQGGVIHVKQSAGRVFSAPTLTSDADFWAELYRHYGYVPHWEAGNIFPGYPAEEP